MWPGRAKATLKFVAGKLTFTGMPRPSFRAHREGPLMADGRRKQSSQTADHHAGHGLRLLGSTASTQSAR
jgi:hypothetical protein